MLSSGFSLAFGSMFAKTYRVHRIFTRSGSSVCKDKMLQDTQLISLVCALLLLDGLVVTLWVLADPMERHLNNLTLEISSTDRSVVYQPQVNNKWITIWSILDFLFSFFLFLIFAIIFFCFWTSLNLNGASNKSWITMPTLKHSRFQFSFPIRSQFTVVFILQCFLIFFAFTHSDFRLHSFKPVEQL